MSQFFTCLQYKSLENTVGKGEIAHDKQFFLSQIVFYLLGKFSAIFINFKIVICRLFQFGKVEKLSFGKG